MRKIYKIVFSILLIAFSTYVLLDTFVLSTGYTKVVETEEEKHDDTIAEVGDDYYKDDNIEINLSTTRTHNTTVYVVDIQVSDIKYLKTAFAYDTYGKNVKQTVSEQAKAKNAIVAINGDYYGVQEKGYVLRNYITYRSEKSNSKEDLVIYGDGTFGIIEEKDTKLSELENAKEVLSFGPALLIDGKVDVTKNEEVSKAMINNPRTAIGIIDKNHYVFVVCDGRTKKSTGLTLYQLANFMKDLNCTIAYNLDGGGSSTLYFNGEVINNPTHNGTKIVEREVSDIVYIGY